jgi:hypothetical protein
MSKLFGRLGRTALVVMLAVAAVSACTTNPPANGNTYNFVAQSVTAIKTPGDWPLTFWDPDVEDEPYLVHMSLRLGLDPVKVSLAVNSKATNDGILCKVKQGDTCHAGPGDGAAFYGLKLPDLLDLANGVPLEIVGSVEFLFEKDALLPAGAAITSLLDGVAQAANAALPAILANGGLPSSPQGILDLIGAVLPGVLTTVLGLVGTVIGNLAGSDNLIGLSPQLFLAVGGSLGDFLRSSIPSLLNLVNWALQNMPNSPLPKGLPIGLGVVGDGAAPVFTSPDQTQIFQVHYGWTMS